MSKRFRIVSSSNLRRPGSLLDGGLSYDFGSAPHRGNQLRRQSVPLGQGHRHGGLPGCNPVGVRGPWLAPDPRHNGSGQPCLAAGAGALRVSAGGTASQLQNGKRPIHRLLAVLRHPWCLKFLSPASGCQRQSTWSTSGIHGKRIVTYPKAGGRAACRRPAAEPPSGSRAWPVAAVVTNPENSSEADISGATSCRLKKHSQQS